MVGTTEASDRKYESLHSNSLIRAAEPQKDNRKGAEDEGGERGKGRALNSLGLEEKHVRCPVEHEIEL